LKATTLVSLNNNKIEPRHAHKEQSTNANYFL